MRLNSILNRYVFFELIPPFVINMVFFTFVFLMAKILDIANLVVNYSVSLLSVIMMLVYAIPSFLVYVIPMSVMMTVLLTFLKLSSDNELIAMKAGGVGLYKLLPPVLFFCGIGFAATLCMGIYGMPWGRVAAKELTYQIAASNLDIGLKERTFNDSFDGVMLYVNTIDIQTKTLVDVFIEDQRTADMVSTVIAPRGQLFGEPEKHLFHLRLYNGTINQVGLKNRSANSIHFDTYDLTLDLNRSINEAKRSRKDEKEMGFRELVESVKHSGQKNSRYYKKVMEIHKKFSIPAACFALGLIAVPLGVQSRMAKRSFGLGLGLAFLLLYYVLLTIGLVLGKRGYYPPFVGMWLPDLLIGGLGVVFLIRTAHERTVGIDRIMYWFQKVKSLNGRWVNRITRSSD